MSGTNSTALLTKGSVPTVKGPPPSFSVVSRTTVPFIDSLQGMYARDGRQFLSDFATRVVGWPVAIHAGACPSSAEAIRALHSNDAPIVSYGATLPAAGTLAPGTYWYRVVGFNPTTVGVPDAAPLTTLGVTITAGQRPVINWTPQNWLRPFQTLGAGHGYFLYRVFGGTTPNFTSATWRTTIVPVGGVLATTFTDDGTVASDTGPAWAAGQVYARLDIRTNGGVVYQCTQGGTSANPGPTGTSPMDIGEGGTCRWTPVLTLDGYPSLVFMKTAVLWAPNESFPTSPRPLGFGTVMAVDSSTPRVLVRIGADPRTGPTSMRYMDVDLLYADGSGFPYTPPIPPGPPRIPPAGGLGGGSSIVGFSVSDSCVFDGTNFVDVLQFFPCDVPTLFASRNYVQGGFLGNDRWGSPAQGWNDRHIIAFDVDANMEYDSIGSNGAGWGGSDEVGTPQLGALQLTKFSGNAADWEASQHRGRGSVAANLPLAAGAVFYDEIFTDPGPLKHGFMLNVMRNRGASLRLDTGVLDFSQAWCVYPASGCDGTGGPNLPPEGARLRLLDDNALRAVKHPITGAPMPIDLSVQYPSAGGWTVYQIKYMRALQEYGLMVVDSALPVDFIGRGALDPSGIYDARWAVVNAPGISQASSQTLAREWYYMFTADASIGGTLAPAWPLNIWHFEMLTLGIRSFDPARTPQIVFGDPHPPIAPGTPPIC